MDNEIVMVIDIPFNTINHPFWPEFTNNYGYLNIMSQTKEWIDYRIDIFMKYTAKSLINQTNQNFICVIRHSKESEQLVLDALSRYEKLPNNIIFTPEGDKYIENIIINYKYLYHIRVDSDNMYSKDFIKNLHQVKFSDQLKCILCRIGYMYEVKGNRMALMYHRSPSFYALVYQVKDFLTGFRHYIADDHWVTDVLMPEIIRSPSFMIIAHDKNISNNFDGILAYDAVKTQVLSDDIRDLVLKSFDIF